MRFKKETKDSNKTGEKHHYCLLFLVIAFNTTESDVRYTGLLWKHYLELQFPLEDANENNDDDDDDDAGLDCRKYLFSVVV